MSTRKVGQTAALAISLLAIGAGPSLTAVAGDERPSSCNALAAEYDLQADAYEEGAARYRAWAKAEQPSATDQDRGFAAQAERLAAAARQSRIRAAESRRSAARTTDSALDGCSTGSAESRS
jgi:hypothetical protein